VLPGELDIDGQPRMTSGKVDMGADQLLYVFASQS
jgi:hypothetical protein